MSAALECWSGRPSTDEDMVEQVLMNNPDRSELSNPSSPSHSTTPTTTKDNNNNKKWQRIGRNFACRIASLKNSLSLDSSNSNNNKQQQQLLWGSVLRSLTQLYPGSQLPEKLISDLRHHFDSLPPSYSHATFDIKDLLLHLRLLDQANSHHHPFAIHIQQHPHTVSASAEQEQEEEKNSINFNLTFACATSISWPLVSAALDSSSVSCDSVQIFDHRKGGLLLGTALLSVHPGHHDNHLRSRVDSAFRSAVRRPRNIAGVKLPFGLCGCQEDKPKNPLYDDHDDVDGGAHDDRIVQLTSPLTPSSILVSVDEFQTVRSPSGEEISRWVLSADEVKFVEQAGFGSFKGCYRGRKVWIEKVRGCGERGSPYDVEIRQDLLQLMTCGQRTILRFLGVCLEDGNGLCVVTRLMDAGSVHDWIQKGKKMAVKEVTRVAQDVAEGLMFMNEHGVAYRDLNAQRILLDKQGNACLGDMGVVSSCRNVGEVTEYETAGYRWLAPEIIAGDPESVTETWMSNVYSFGMVIWEMVTGEAAYSSYSPVQAAVGIAACALRPEIPKDCPQVLRLLMMKCWNNCPSKRPTFSEIISILQKHNNR